jgi:hypothetical protein
LPLLSVACSSNPGSGSPNAASDSDGGSGGGADGGGTYYGDRCTQDSDCRADQTCNKTTALCVPIGTCVTDTDCAPSEHCNDTKCVGATGGPSDAGGGGTGCKQDQDCDGGACDNGVCTPAAPGSCSELLYCLS